MILPRFVFRRNVRSVEDAKLPGNVSSASYTRKLVSYVVLMETSGKHAFRGGAASERAGKKLDAFAYTWITETRGQLRLPSSQARDWIRRRGTRRTSHPHIAVSRFTGAPWLPTPPPPMSVLIFVSDGGRVERSALWSSRRLGFPQTYVIFTFLPRVIKVVSANGEGVSIAADTKRGGRVGSESRSERQARPW